MREINAANEAKSETVLVKTKKDLLLIQLLPHEITNYRLKDCLKIDSYKDINFSEVT